LDNIKAREGFNLLLRMGNSDADKHFNKNSNGMTAIDVSDERGLTVEYVQQTGVFDFNRFGETQLYRAVVDNRPVAKLQNLIDEGADENVRCDYNMETPLLRSMYYRNSGNPIILFLQQTPNAPVDVGDHHGTTPLHKLVSIMIWAPGDEMVYLEQLLRKGANPFRRDNEGYTPRDRFEETAAQMKHPVKAFAIAVIDRLKIVEDSLVEAINHPRSMAVMMAVHKRLGTDSSLSELDPDILRMIIEHSMGALMTPYDIGEMQIGEVKENVQAVMAKLDETP